MRCSGHENLLDKAHLECMKSEVDQLFSKLFKANWERIDVGLWRRKSVPELNMKICKKKLAAD